MSKPLPEIPRDEVPEYLWTRDEMVKHYRATHSPMVDELQVDTWLRWNGISPIARVGFPKLELPQSDDDQVLRTAFSNWLDMRGLTRRRRELFDSRTFPEKFQLSNEYNTTDKHGNWVQA